MVARSRPTAGLASSPTARGASFSERAMKSGFRAALAAVAVVALTLSGCVVYDPVPAYPAYPAAVYPAAPVYGPPVYGSVGVSIGTGWGGGGWHHHHW